MVSYVFGGGCFWCLDAVFRQLQGVLRVESGYAGGHIESPDYSSVSSGTTGHAEVVRVIFDEKAIPSDVILDAFFVSHDPTTPNRQGADVGIQYRSVMLYETPDQKEVFKQAIMKAQGNWDKPVVTEIVPLEKFYLAETEHQDYFSKRPESGYCQAVIAPKVIKARTALRRWIK